MITTILFHRVARDRWHWPRSRTWPLSTLLLAVDVAFFSANFVKIEEGGWFPLAAAAGVFALMSTWKRGREVLRAQLQGAGLPLELFIHDLERHPPLRVPGTAIFMASDPGGVPPVLLHHLKHNKVLHERVLFVSVLTEEIPAVPDAERISVKVLGGETLLPNGSSRLAGWRKRLFIVMSRNAQPASAFFGLPPNRVVEMGAQIQL